MSQWNSHNSRQYNGPNNWNNEQSGQYVNHSSYYNQQHHPNSQYVSFNQFINQIQGNGAPNNMQYPNYANQQYEYSNVPSTSNSYGAPSYDQNAGPSREQPPSLNKDTVFKSNLTATAVEFVPKSSQPPQDTRSTVPSPIDPPVEDIPQSSNSNQTYESSNNYRSERNKSSYNEPNGQSRYDGYRNQRKINKEYNNKGNNNNGGSKDSDATRTFYNSSVPRTSQDVRNGGKYVESSNGRNRNWSGTQRARNDRNSYDDEYYASYSNYPKQERTEKNNKIINSPVKKNKVSIQANSDMTQRERLSEQLDRGQLECLVCCEQVKQTDSVWSCCNCFNIQHLRCIKRWATSSIQEGKWRCPACQNTSVEIPTEYRCMCGVVRNPEYVRGLVGAHTCGQSCGRPRTCIHPCTLLCHPGPCPPCQATVHKTCCCGAENRTVTCSSKQPQLCTRVCNKTLACTSHVCQQNCHEGPCDECNETVEQICYCPSACSRTVACTASSAGRTQWSCGAECARVLACGAHVCHAVCHPPPCASCELMPDSVTVCPCGQTEIKKGTRKSCTDPIPLCGNLCAKRLACGPVNDRHFCKTECHEGECPVCPDQTVVACRCGHTNRVIPCCDLPDMIDNVFCQKKCNKKLSCGRHRCRGTCCVLTSHRCGLACGRALACGLHRCGDTCHTGHCPPCPDISFSELTCECGLEVILPPVRCGTRPPPCTRTCTKPRPCGHAPHHACHPGDCPPCCVLTARSCHGGHEERKTIPCSQEEFSCGMPCGKPLSCGNHTCIKTCHKGPCDTEKCTQPCTAPRTPCGHPCGAPCHPGTCPAATPCRRTVTATCPCRRRSAPRACHDAARDRARIVNALAASKMQEGGSVDLSEVTRPTNNHVTLDCDDECRVEARTRQMALALQIKNPDISSKLAPRYSEHVRQWANRDPTFAQQIHDKLTDLVHLAKKSKQKTRAHSFPSMNWQKRQFIHELCEHFGCESVAYDAEPNRNVVATADKEKSWLPAMSVLEVLGREAGKRRVPGPVLRNNAPVTAATGASQPVVSTAKTTSGWATLTSTNAWAARSNQNNQPPATTEIKPTPPVIDYFDYPPDN